MEFLKEILGEELYEAFAAKINEYNGNEANAGKLVKLANLAGGDYVSKLKYDDLATQLSGKQAEIDTATNLINDLKKAAKGNEDIQNKINEYEQQVDDLLEELAETKVKSALKVALLSEKAVDIDYLTYKLGEKMSEQETSIELDENDNIKGWDEMLSGLKTQFPTMFESAAIEGKGKVIEPKKLPDSDKRTGYTKAELLKKPYAERQEIYNADPEAYKEIMNS